uniref:Putative transcription factor TFIIB zinc-binding motif n=1 Tax=viral metagenome TaxID=1070528 RepID=A0A6M3JJR1_9ZZZZ
MDGQTDITLVCPQCGEIRQFDRHAGKRCSRCGTTMEDDSDMANRIWINANRRKGENNANSG